MNRVIPALDIRQGQVARAKGGERARYKPIRSALTRGANPVQVIDDLLQFAPFPVFYLADLDSIMGEAAQHELIVELCVRNPALEFWVDAGPPPDPRDELPANFRPVIGTEFIDSWDDRSDRAILSLDFDLNGLRGGSGIWTRPKSWPSQVIAMCLHKVGSMEGPDLDLLSRIRDIRPDCDLVAAGGIRDANDIHRLLNAGVDVLVASALHQGKISAEEIPEAKRVSLSSLPPIEESPRKEGWRGDHGKDDS